MALDTENEQAKNEKGSLTQKQKGEKSNAKRGKTMKSEVCSSKQKRGRRRRKRRKRHLPVMSPPLQLKKNKEGSTKGTKEREEEKRSHYRLRTKKDVAEMRRNKKKG